MRFKRLLGRLKVAATPSPPAGNLATDTVTQAGWLTYGIALPQGAANDIKITGVTTQVDVKAQWADASIKHAIVTAPIAGTGSMVVNAGVSDTGSFSPTWPTCTVTFVQSNSPGSGASAAGTYVATLGSYTATDPWLSGVNVNAASVWKTPVLGGVTDHTNLRVRFDVYSYNDNKHVIDVAVENTLNNATNVEYKYAITIAVGGVSQHHEDAIFHLPLQVKTRRVTSGGPTLAEVARDMTPFYRSGAIPQYLSDVQDMRSGTHLSSLTAHGFNSMDGLGPFLLPMDSHGGRPEIGLITAWCVSWIAHQRQEQYDYIQKLTEYAGNYTVHMRASDNSDVYRLANGDDTWLHHTAAGSYLPAMGATAWQPTPMSATLTSNGTTATATVSAGLPGFLSVGQFIRFTGVVGDAAWNGSSFVIASIPSSTTFTFAAPNGTTSLTGTITANILAPHGELAHLPNMAFVQYLVSGRRRAMDEMIYYANFALLVTQPEYRGFGWGYLSGASTNLSNATRGLLNAQGPDAGNELRGMAWGLRDLAQCGKWLPDNNSLKTYFATCAQNNINDHDAYATAMATSPGGDIYGAYQNSNVALDATFPRKRPQDGDYPGKTWLSSFEQGYMTQVLHFTIRNQGWTGGTVALAQLLQFWSRLADTNQIPAPFDISYLSPYFIAAGSVATGPLRITFYTTMADVYNHSYTASVGGGDGPIDGANDQNAVDCRVILMIAAADGYAGASAGVTYIDRVGGIWNSQYRTDASYTPFAFSSVAVPS